MFHYEAELQRLTPFTRDREKRRRGEEREEEKEGRESVDGIPSCFYHFRQRVEGAEYKKNKMKLPLMAFSIYVSRSHRIFTPLYYLCCINFT